MRKFATVFLFMLCFWAKALAQEVVATLDLDSRDPIPSFFEYVSADKGLVTMGPLSKKSSRYLGVTKYDESFAKVWSHQVLEQNGRNHVEFVTALGGEILAFFSEYFPQGRSTKSFFSAFDLEGNPLAERKEIGEFTNMKVEDDGLNYTRSLNKKVLLCYRSTSNAGKPESFSWFLFQNGHEGFQSGDISLPYPDDKFKFRRIMVSNQGNIYILGKFYTSSNVLAPDDYGFKLFKYNTSEGKMSEYTVDAGELFLTDLTLKVDRDENAYLAGFFSHKNQTNITGTLFYKLDDSLHLQVEGVQRFSDDFMSKFMSERQLERGKELQNFYLDNIILRSDGGVLLVAEKFYLTYNSYVDLWGFWQNQKIFHYDDVIINSVSADGSLEWSSVAYKRQSSETPDNLGYVDVVSGENLFLVYQYQERRSPTQLFQTQVGMDGQVNNRAVLYSNSNSSENLFPRYCEQVSNNEAILVTVAPRNRVWSIKKVSFEQGNQ